MSKNMDQVARDFEALDEYDWSPTDVDAGRLMEEAHAAGAALATTMGRSRAGVPEHARRVWDRSMRSVCHEMDRSGFTRMVLEEAPELLAETRLDSEEFVDIETELVLEHFPESQLTREDVEEIAEKAERHREEFLEMLREREDLSALEFFDVEQSRGAKEAGAYLGAVNLTGATIPEPFVSKGIAVASVTTGFIAQGF